MWRKSVTSLIVVLAMLVAGSTVMAQQYQRDRSDDDYDYDTEYRDNSQNDDSYREDYIRVDRNLDADVWVNRSDNEYFIGDNIKMHYRVNADAYVAIVSIDSRGRVNLLYPSQPGDNPWRRGGITYTLPGADDDFDLIVDGPEGNETIQIIASREQFSIPNWYNGSGIVCRDDDDRDEFMDYLTSRYFHRHPDQRFAVDREVIWVEEWEPDYFRPVYYPTYPAWSVCGNVYFDYPWGASVYIDGIYWGSAPLYIPRVLVGWRTITIYDRYGYCWEDYVHVNHYNTVILNQTIIRPRPGVVSKYKEVHVVGYRDPVKNGYPNYNEVVKKQTRVSGKIAGSPSNGVGANKRNESDASSFAALPKKHVRGDGAVVKTERGYESSTIGGSSNRSTADRRSSKARFDGNSGSTSDRSGSDRGSYNQAERKSSSGSSKTYDSKSKTGTSDYYRKRRGTVEKRSGNSKSGSSSGRTVERKERTKSQPAQVEQRKAEKSDKGSSDGGSSKSGGEVKQKSSSSGNSGGSARQSSPRSSGGETRSKGKGKN